MVAIANQRATTSRVAKKANAASSDYRCKLRRNLRNAEVAAAMGMMTNLMTAKWRDKQDDMLELNHPLARLPAGFSAIIKTMQVAMQSAAITTGASLAIVSGNFSRVNYSSCTTAG